jgi:hypothetical protein
MSLTVENVRREIPGSVGRRPLPQQQPLLREVGIPRVAVPAGRIAEPVACTTERLDDRFRELPAGIREVQDGLAELVLEPLLRSGELFGNGVRRLGR